MRWRRRSNMRQSAVLRHLESPEARPEALARRRRPSPGRTVASERRVVILLVRELGSRRAPRPQQREVRNQAEDDEDSERDGDDRASADE